MLGQLRNSRGSVSSAVGEKHLSNYLRSTFRNVRCRNYMDIKRAVAVTFGGLAVTLKYWNYKCMNVKSEQIQRIIVT